MKKILFILIMLGVVGTSLMAGSWYVARRNADAAMIALRSQGYYIKSVAGRYLRHGHYRTYNRYLYRGNCYAFVGVGDDTVTDLDSILYDRYFNFIASDRLVDNIPTIYFCPRYSGLYRIRTRMYGGYGYFYQVIGWK